MEISVRLVEGEIAPGNAALQSGPGHAGLQTRIASDPPAAGLKTGEPRAAVNSGAPSETGAVVTFDGVVRRMEEGRKLLALDYEAYEPMASRELGRLARELAAKHTQGKAQIQAVCVWHSVGRVPVGGCSFRLAVASAHRKEALAFMDEFIDEMKKQVPLWKNPVFA